MRSRPDQVKKFRSGSGVGSCERVVCRSMLREQQENIQAVGNWNLFDEVRKEAQVRLLERELKTMCWTSDRACERSKCGDERVDGGYETTKVGLKCWRRRRLVACGYQWGKETRMQQDEG